MSNIMQTLAKLSNDFKVEGSAAATKKLKQAADESTLKANNLMGKITEDAHKLTREKVGAYPEKDHKNYEHHKKSYEENLAHHIGTHPKLHKHILLEKEAAHHRVAYKKHLRSQG